MAKHSDQSRHLRQKDIIDREERAQFRSQGVELAPRWREVIGETPVLEPADTKGATQFLLKIEAAIGAGGWTRQERNGLKRLRRKWRRKVDGGDEWFNVAGNPYGGDRIKYYGGVKGQGELTDGAGEQWPEEEG
jgi:hypothetical protein